MKNLIKLIVSVVMFCSCGKDTYYRCVSCIAESNSGKILQYKIECSSTSGFLEGFTQGLRDFYKDNGDTATVFCIYSN